MRAETAFNVFQELSPGEKERFFRMCDAVKSELKKSNKKNDSLEFHKAIIRKKLAKKPLITDAQATEFLIGKLKKKK